MSLFPATDWSGTCGFRLLPGDDFSSGPSSARLTPVAGGVALALDYTWTHPEQGEQAGHLVIGRPDDDGRVTASFADSFHQAPEIRVLDGTAAGGEPTTEAPAAVDPVASHPITGEGLAVSIDYSGWGWTVAVRLQGGTLAMVMQNVVPEGVPGAEPGPYDVMRAAWTRTDA
ncbi:hypothetical protein [Micrococcus lacusdianchii]|uniref:hypothetical protein n=1 Tax=Micrococcus lacusdianchii TaxID=2915940 RepID=UPI0020063CC5|nr:hypothetical protein [Micrococcus sp. JXJ CY 30]